MCSRSSECREMPFTQNIETAAGLVSLVLCAGCDFIACKICATPVTDRFANRCPQGHQVQPQAVHR